VLHHFPGAHVEYRFKCRSKGIDLQPYIEEIRSEIHDLCQIKFSEDELDYLRNLRFIKGDFVEFLGLFHLPEKCISVTPGQEPGEISIEVKGSWLHTILFEIPVLAIVNEVYFRNKAPDLDYQEGRRRLVEKIQLITSSPDMSNFKVAEYGTRRRFSGEWHHEVVQTLQKQMGGNFAGTSNVLMAKQYGVTPLGTMGHEYLQACQALGPRLRDSQVFALEKWAKEYRGDLGIALSDVYGTNAFLRDFDMYFCKLFDGARHDSGDPFEWGERLLAYYRNNRVDPSTKTLVFSDGLSFPVAMD